MDACGGYDTALHGTVNRSVEDDVAGAGRRFLGRCIDGVVLVPLSLILRFAVFHAGRTSPPGLRLAVFALGAGYEVGAIALWGRTVGKLATGTRVVMAETGRPPAWWAATLRWAPAGALAAVVGLGRVSSGAMASIGFFELLVQVGIYGGVLWDPRRQGLHDKLAGTVVVLALPGAPGRSAA
jgi:uncharacterized RDD family membrane protein YckC